MIVSYLELFKKKYYISSDLDILLNRTCSKNCPFSALDLLMKSNPCCGSETSCSFSFVTGW
jgi:hypothetical protein